MGGPVPRQRRIGRQTTLGPHPQGLQMARDRADRGGARQSAYQRRLRRRPVSAVCRPPQYRRRRPRRGHTRALGAVKHSIIVACWHMLSTGETYREAGGDYFTRLDPDKQTRRLVAQLERLGHVVTLQEAAAA